MARYRPTADIDPIRPNGGNTPDNGHSLEKTLLTLTKISYCTPLIITRLLPGWEWPGATPLDGRVSVADSGLWVRGVCPQGKAGVHRQVPRDPSS